MKGQSVVNSEVWENATYLHMIWSFLGFNYSHIIREWFQSKVCARFKMLQVIVVIIKENPMLSFLLLLFMLITEETIAIILIATSIKWYWCSTKFRSYSNYDITLVWCTDRKIKKYNVTNKDNNLNIKDITLNCFFFVFPFFVLALLICFVWFSCIFLCIYMWMSTKYWLPEVINIEFLPIISIYCPTNRYWENSNLLGKSCYYDLTLNFHNWSTRKCVAARGEN